MSPTEQRAVLTIALLAAFADGLKDEREREAIKRVADSLAGPEDAPQLAAVYQEVLLKRVDLEQVAAAITDPSTANSRTSSPSACATPMALRTIRSVSFWRSSKRTLG